MVTMRDVAARANVSVATVSFVVNGSKPISSATTARVEQAMRELGYRRNPVGAALARGRTKIIGMLYPALQRPLSGTVGGFFTSATARARERGYQLVLWPISNDSDETMALADTGLVDGVLLMEVQLNDSRVPALIAGRTPFALIGRTAEPEGLAYVDVDFAATVSSAVATLTDLGHREFCLVTGGTRAGRFEAHGPAERSRSSFLTNMESAGLRGSVRYCSEDSSEGRAFGRTFRDEHPETTALLLLNEHAAPGIVIGLRDAGVRVPGDLSIISLGSSSHMAGMADPALTFMRSPADELGRLGVDTIIDRIENPEAELAAVLLPCEMVPGQSIAEAPSRG
ncbi:Catabolite control protein A [Microbacterium sp. SA39]|nr:Catabolite control protein A [Microbacterium sp. SA39]